MGDDRAPVVVAVVLVAALVGAWVSQGVPVSWALRVVVGLVSLGVLCWQVAKWADGDGEP